MLPGSGTQRVPQAALSAGSARAPRPGTQNFPLDRLVPVRTEASLSGELAIVGYDGIEFAAPQQCP